MLGAPLPTLTLDLEQKLTEIGEVESLKYLIYHWGSYLYECTAGKPSKLDYRNLAANIIKKYPNLATDNGESVRTLCRYVCIYNFLSIKICKTYNKSMGEVKSGLTKEIPFFYFYNIKLFCFRHCNDNDIKLITIILCTQL